MNKQEAIEIVESRAFNIGDIDLACGLSYTKHIINQIDEPQKVVVPKFVAEWVGYCKFNRLTLLGAFDPVSELGVGLVTSLTEELRKGKDWAQRNQETFARAWLDGYEIEQEKLYTVEIPSPNKTTEPIIYLSRDERGKIFLTSWFLFASQSWKKHPHSHLTESEIKQDFEWAWKWAKEVENKCK